MLYIEDQHLAIETIGPGLITSDGTRLSERHLAELVGAMRDGQRIERVRVVFIVEEEAERMLPMIARYGFECRAFDEQGRERVLVESRALEPTTLIPILRESSWPHRDAVMHRRLLDEQSPLVTFAWDAPGNATRDLVKPDDERAIADVEAEALANLERVPYDLEHRGPTLVVWHELAAELVLLPRALADFQQALGTDHVLIGAPIRGGLIVTGPDRASALVASTRGMFDKAKRNRVSPVPFIARDGALVGHVREAKQPWWHFW